MDAKQAADKIRKLLALSSSDNVGEASNALLMARKLMAQFKLSEKDVEESKPCKLNRMTYNELTYSGLRNIWMPLLANVIATNHCCGVVAIHGERSTVHKICFIGLDDDPSMAMVMFDYAVHHIRHKGACIRKEMRDECFYSASEINEYVKQYITNYGIGFSQGLKQKYDEQNIEASSETMMVLVRPKEVVDYLSGLSDSKLKIHRQPLNEDAKSDGYDAGYKFDPTKQINESKERRCLNGSCC